MEIKVPSGILFPDGGERTSRAKQPIQRRTVIIAILKDGKPGAALLLFTSRKKTQALRKKRVLVEPCCPAE